MTVGIVLAGGRSRRMGRDKALLDWQGRPLLDHMIALVREAGVDEVVVSGRPWSGYAHVADDHPDGGPAAALIACAKHLPSHERALAVPVDMPLLSLDDLRPLLAAGVAYYEDHPLPAVFPLAPLRGADADTGLSMRTLLRRLGVTALSVPPDAEARRGNVNTPAAFDEAKARS